MVPTSTISNKNSKKYPYICSLLFVSLILISSSSSSTLAMAFAAAGSSSPSSPPPSLENSQQQQQQRQETTEESENNDINVVPQLPAGDPNDTSIPRIRLGETIRLEEMGPIILNTDGTTRRIDNWDALTEHERQVTWRRISKRNEERRQKLLLAEQKQKQQQQQRQKNEQNDNNTEGDERQEL
jgi:flagellum-specific peptidoglycan hydrolase FlgJ